MSIQTKTLSVRVKDRHAALLRQMAYEVNQIFNLANEITRKAYSNAGDFGAQIPEWLSAFDVQKLTAGIQKACAAAWQNGQVKFAGHFLKVWDSYGLSGYKFRAGSFSEDSRGRWYFNICVQVECQPAEGTTATGVDLGLKDYATPSHGEKLARGNFYRDLEPALGKAQRARKKTA